jgi:hypothetical protein
MFCRLQLVANKFDEQSALDKQPVFLFFKLAKLMTIT